MNEYKPGDLVWVKDPTGRFRALARIRRRVSVTLHGHIINYEIEVLDHAAFAKLAWPILPDEPYPQFHPGNLMPLTDMERIQLASEKE